MMHDISMVEGILGYITDSELFDELVCDKDFASLDFMM